MQCSQLQEIKDQISFKNSGITSTQLVKIEMEGLSLESCAGRSFLFVPRGSKPPTSKFLSSPTQRRNPRNSRKPKVKSPARKSGNNFTQIVKIEIEGLSIRELRGSQLFVCSGSVEISDQQILVKPLQTWKSRQSQTKQTRFSVEKSRPVNYTQLARIEVVSRRDEAAPRAAVLL